MFATDRDLLALEPLLFRDQQWLGQTILSATGSITSGVLTLTGATTAALAPGHVVIINRIPAEIVSISSSTQLVVSLLRPDLSSPSIPPPNVTGAPITITTFAPQIAIVHAQILQMLGLAPASAPQEGVPSESSITNPQDLRLIEALGALHLIYAAASAPLGDTSTFAQRAAMYKDRFARERWRVHADIDLNADTLPDARRSLAITHLLRT